MQKRIIYSFLLFFQVAFAHKALSQDFIYRVTIDGKRVQSGFKAKGINGIITALHGITGFTRINVQKFGSNQIYNDQVEITKIDVDNDICIISSRAINDIPISEGYNINPKYSIQELKGKVVQINGFPLGMFAKQNSDIKFDNDNPVIELQAFLPSNLATALSKRKSPATNIMIFPLHGVIAPGHSGSPILYNNDVIGMADGGLNGGSVGYGWAIILRNVRWSDFINNDTYAKLSNENDILFAYEFSPNLETETFTFQTQDEVNCKIINSIIDECKNSFNYIIENYYYKDSGEIKFYRSKANYFNAILSTISTIAEINNSKMGTLTCLLYQEKNVFNDPSNEIEDEYIPKSTGRPDENNLSFSNKESSIKQLISQSIEYKRMYNNYLLLKFLFNDCLASRISNRFENIDTDGELSSCIQLGNDNVEVRILIEGKKLDTWNLKISFFNKLSLIKDMDAFKYNQEH